MRAPLLVGRVPWAFEGAPGWVEMERDPLGRRMWEEGPSGVREGRRALSKAGWGEAARQGCQGKGEGRVGG